VYGGQNINSVPNSAGFTIDFRTIPAHDHGRLVSDIENICGDEAAIEIITDFAGSATDPNDPNIEPLMDILAARLGARPQPTGAPYFTDASALVPGFDNVATVVIGPGEAAQCHQTDEFCYVQHIDDAFDIDSSLIERMCK
jgi:succinyl-diaminopimelate desuccinylase